ncbi:phage tail protein [Pseudomonas cremoricolorata]|uniref:phage tail protein n=1 Tax=Pseudomonas cremoricolorata TaxID=157783 RepID=UPI0004056CD0|nr:phage tail protein [Pseudomonas cremoricolorata]
MNKPDSLRAHLLAAVPGLEHNPDRLLLFIDKGRVRCTAASSLSFEYSYELQLILTDFAGHPDSVMLPILGWLRTHQSELLVNLDKSNDGVQFEADILDRGKVDLSLTLPLTERVLVKRQADDSFDVSHPEDPGYAPYSDCGRIELHAGGELLAAWQPPPAPDGMALVTPTPKRDRHG